MGESFKEMVTLTYAILRQTDACGCVLFSPRDHNALWAKFEVSFCE